MLRKFIKFFLINFFTSTLLIYTKYVCVQISVGIIDIIGISIVIWRAFVSSLCETSYKSIFLIESEMGNETQPNRADPKQRHAERLVEVCLS